MKKLLFLFLPLVTGGIAAFLTCQGMTSYQMLEKPAFSPPGILFPIVWTILYLLMGIASYLVITSDASAFDRWNAVTVYLIQLFVNFLWPVLFFNFGLYLFSFLWLVFLWILIVITLRRFYPISRSAAWLLVPYLLWVTFAGYLNLSVYLLNR